MTNEIGGWGYDPNICIHMVFPGGSNVRKRWGTRPLDFALVCLVEAGLPGPLSHPGP